MPRYRKGPSTCFDNNLSVRADAAVERASVILLWGSCDAAHACFLCRRTRQTADEVTPSARLCTLYCCSSCSSCTRPSAPSFTPY